MVGGAQEHVLFFHDVAGVAQVERHPSLPLAVQRVEQLANDEGVTDCELFTLDPVRLQRRQRWHVAVAADATGVPSPRSAPPAATAAPTSPPPAAPPRRAAADPVGHPDPLDVEIVDEVFHDAVREVGREVEPAGALQHDRHDGAEAPESADVLPSPSRGRGLGFFVHQ